MTAPRCGRRRYTEDGKPKLNGVDPDDVGTVTRADGTKQLTIGDWPVYRYAGDKKPGQWLGQNVGSKWFVIKPDGTKNLTCLPKPSKPIAPPADDDGSDRGRLGRRRLRLQLLIRLVQRPVDAHRR